MSSIGQNSRKGMGVVQWIDDRRYCSDDHGEVFKHQMGDLMLERTRKLFRKDLRGHFGCINAIEFSNNGGHWIVSGGDDRRVLLWNVEKALDGKGSPAVMKGQHNSNIFCLAYDNNNDKIFSGGNDEQVIVHDAKSGETVNVFLHQDALYGLSVDPLNDNVFASACDDGRVLIFDIRQPSTDDPFVLARCGNSPMHAVMYNPMDSRLIATANAKQGAALWDIRKPKSVLVTYGVKPQSCMSVRFNSSGDRLLALRRRLPPVLYDIHSKQPVMQFHNSGYYNSCTMKSCSFAGSKDQYILSGSDDFRLYMWKIPDSIPEDRWSRQADFVLEGHRSIVNQVRYNADNSLIISSGVEKIIKVWSPFSISGDDGVSVGGSKTRPIFSQNDYMDLLVHSGPVMTHDYTNGSTEEDPRMIAFFDTLVQHELEGATTDDDGPFDSSVEVVNNEISDLESSLTQSDVESLPSPFSPASRPRTSVEFDMSVRLPYSSSDSSTSPSQSLSSTSSSSSDDNCDDGDRHFDSNDSSLSGVNAAVRKIEENGTRASSPTDAILNRLKRIRRSVVSDSDSQSQDAEARPKRRRIQNAIFPRAASQSSISETEERATRHTVPGNKEQNDSTNGNQDAMDGLFSDCNRETNLFQSYKSLGERLVDHTSSVKLNRVLVSTRDGPNLPVSIDWNDDVAGFSLNVSSSHCDPVSNETPNISNNGTSKSQAVQLAVGNTNGVSSTSERFRQIKNHEKLSDRKYRSSTRKSKDSESDSD